jgi:pimeloyl-ACP methyl ester carboxylesterase
VFPVGRAEERLAARKSVELTERCWARSGWLLPHLGTANVARDLDLLRQAVGDSQLNYLGYSYGTYLGQVYANLFPDRVGAFVLDGVVNPIDYTHRGRGLFGRLYTLRIGGDLASAESLEIFLAKCAEAGPACPFAAGGDPHAKFATLAERLRTDPVQLPTSAGPQEIGYAELVKITVERGLYSAYRWRSFAATLQALYTLSEGGSVMPIPVPPLGAPGDAIDETGIAITCADSDSASNPRLWPAMARAADRRAPHVGSYWTYVAQSCAS